MAGEASLVSDFAVVLGVAAVTGVASHRLRLSPILGYLVAGLLVGASLPFSSFGDVNRVHALSELGVVLVMFAVGLEFRLSSVTRVVPTAGLAAVFQIGGMFWVGTALGDIVGLPRAGQVVLAASLCISSTMTVSSIFRLHVPPADVRRMTLGVLVLQDVVAIVLITVVTVVAQGSGTDASEILRFVGVLALELGGLVVIGLVIVPRVGRMVAGLRRPEIDAVFAAGLCFALAAAVEHLGYSSALGAFVAGMLLAEAGLGERYERVIAPVRDVFAAIFFVSVGMSVNPFRVVDSLPIAALIAALVALGQFVFITTGGLLSGAGLRRSGHAGLALGQLGEFSFVIAGVGTATGVLPSSWLTVLVATSVLTTLSTTLVLGRVDSILVAIEHVLPARLREGLVLYTAWMQRLASGVHHSAPRRRVRRLLTWVVIDGAVVAGIVIGGATLLPSTLDSIRGLLGVSTAAATAVALLAIAMCSVPFAVGAWRQADALGAVLAEIIFPKAAPHVADVASSSRRTVTLALRLGARLAVGFFILSLSRPFVPLGIGAGVLAIAIAPSLRRLWRSGDPLDAHVKSATKVLLETMQMGGVDVDDPQVQTLRHTLGDAVYLRLSSESTAAGHSLAELDLRARTGVSILAIVGADNKARPVLASTVLQPDDILAVAGAHDAVERARVCLVASRHDPAAP